MAMELNNGQKCPASFDLYDSKDKPFEVLPDGASVVFASTNDQIAQWEQDADPVNIGKGMITTLHDEVGNATINGTMTLADGTVFQGSIDVVVIHSAAGAARFTSGLPIDE